LPYNFYFGLPTCAFFVSLQRSKLFKVVKIVNEQTGIFFHELCP
jgi:hypothetical protein